MAHMNISIEQSAASGNLEAVRSAIETGVDITKNDNAALRFATLGDHIPVMQILIDAGATPDSRMLLAALRRGRNLSIRFLLLQGIPFDELWLVNPAIFENITAETVALLINVGLPVVEAHMNPKLSTLNYTAYCAMSRGDIQTFLFVSALGADTKRIVKESLFSVFKWRDHFGSSVRNTIHFAEIAKACSGISSGELRLLEENVLEEFSSSDERYFAVKLFQDWIRGKFDLLSPADWGVCENKY